MSIDTSAIDSQITDLTAQLAKAQSDLDTDPLTIALTQHTAKGMAVSDLTAQIQELTDKKSQLVDLDSQLTTLSASITDKSAQLNAVTP